MPIAKVTSLEDAKTNLAALVDEAAAGEEIVIAKDGEPKTRFVPLVSEHERRPFGLYRTASTSPTTSTRPGPRRSGARWKARTPWSPKMRLRLGSNPSRWFLMRTPSCQNGRTGAVVDVTDMYLSHGAVWEMTIERGIGRFTLPRRSRSRRKGSL